MINIINDSKDPYFNLALEEYFVKYKDLYDDLFVLWQNEPTIVIGKNQNTYEELDLDYVNKNNINVIRRMSGGGAVYHDLGNLNYTIIKNDGRFYKNDFSFFALPVISCLKKFGIEATFGGRNDILIDRKKFSGNAQYFYKDKILHHGTLLFSSDLSILTSALNVKKEKFESKGIQSVKSRVTNISEYVEKPVSLNDFRKALILSMFDENEKSICSYKLTDQDISAIIQLRNEKYKTWDWNFGQSPPMNYQKELRFDAGSVTLALNIKGARIERCKLYGDFFEAKSVDELEQHFTGIRYEKSEIESILCNIDIPDYIHKLMNDEFRRLFFDS